MIIQARNDGRYGFVITRTDNLDWEDGPLDTFASLDEASDAAVEALEKYRRSTAHAD
jgi:hypothetical protein